MVKKLGGGKKHKKKKNDTSNTEIERKLEMKEDGLEYAQVTKVLGNCRLELNCMDGKKRLGNIRGNMRKKVWIILNDLVLVSLRDFEDNKCDIILKYSPKEVKKLISLGEIPETIKVNEPSIEKEDEKNDIGVDFIESDDEKNDDDDVKKPEINIDDI